MPHLLVVEDDRPIAELIRLYLRRDGHEVEIVGNGASALRLLESDPTYFSLIILDVMLPGLDGRGLCRRVRETSSIPIIMLTALDDDRDKIEGLELGADDYLTKPFNPDELVARVRALLRRAGGHLSSAPTLTQNAPIEIGNLTLDPLARRLTIIGQEISLRTREFDLLLMFVTNQGIVLNRDQLLEKVWENDFDGDTRTVDVHVSRLRDRLRAANATVEIETVRSVGYRLSAH
jgi:DNA-binding response OmpR family regulator